MHTSLDQAPAAGSRPPDHERSVRERYARAALALEPALCCPVTDYEGGYLDLLPQEIIDKDYGCGDPARHVRAGETVLDLGSGAGKVCYILTQKVGPKGRVIGIDMNEEMLALARRYLDEMAEKVGHRNVSFHKARIQDLALDLERAEGLLERAPITGLEQLAAFEAECARLRREEPLVPVTSVDVIVSSCVLNLVGHGQRAALFAQMRRVLKPGGRAVISDIVCDRPPTRAILEDPEHWSGCIAGAFEERELLAEFERAGFGAVEILARSAAPWRVIDGIEFRSMTVRAVKLEPEPCIACDYQVVYRGPWKQVQDDEGHTFQRGERADLCERTHGLLTDPAGPYAGQMLSITDPGRSPAAAAAAPSSACEPANGEAGCC